MDKISKICGEKSMKALVLFSGGLDSTTCLALAVKEYGANNVIALSLYYGQKHKKEIEAANRISEYYNVQHICYNVAEIFEGSDCSLIYGNADVPPKSYKEQLEESGGKPVSTYVPYRNGLFLSIAASVAISKGCKVIYYGAHKDDAAGNAYPDCSINFHNAVSQAIYIGSGNKVEVIDPFINKNKADIVKIGTEIDVPYGMTWSCYNGREKPCGKCGTCIDRIEAFKKNGISDPLQYD
jgi:7-cyano-7-deazaguanine synthase